MIRQILLFLAVLSGLTGFAQADFPEGIYSGAGVVVDGQVKINSSVPMAANDGTRKDYVDSKFASGVTGVKGNAEATYRTGQVNLTAANIGIVNATSSVAGISKIYSVTGANTDGSMTQAAITTALALKADDSSALHTNSTSETKTGQLTVGSLISSGDITINNTVKTTSSTLNLQSTNGANNNRLSIMSSGGNYTEASFFSPVSGVDMYFYGGANRFGGISIGDDGLGTNTGDLYLRTFAGPVLRNAVIVKGATGFIGFNGVTSPSRVIDTGTAPIKIGDGVNSTDAVTKAQSDLKANIASPALTGTPTAPTATSGTNTTQLATTAFVTAADNLKANIASPTFTGDPKAPTPAPGDNDTSIATTAFVQNAVGALTFFPQSAASVSGSPTSFNVTLSLFGKNGVLIVYVDASTSAKTINLPNYTDMISAYVVKIIKVDSSANAVTIQGDANINGASTYLLTAQYQNVQIESGLTHYWITN